MSIKNTNDPRVKRTKQLIQDAFITLVGEKGFENVTVQHIAERAPVNRATFYSHYHDKYDLLEKTITEMLETLTEAIRPTKRNKEDFQLTFDSPHPSFLALFEHIAKNESFYRVMLGDQAAGNYGYKMMKTIQTHLTLSLSIAQPNDEKLIVPRDILISYITGAHLGIIMSWLKKGTIYTPHFMALQLTRLIILGAHTAAGLERPF
ncbi:TetR/AcrR family transcriptional regulator C-terminal domain-containing protein [Bacillus cytotoxicus]|uniref:TetR/AcrR family transcriptional regulator n=1 Tax=Bacillus cereus group sp. BfR-BA-01492 TaxID=2920361 RepID=UPI001F583EA8|nr:TetR/AcrR family transcriptional regulator C-terminal domain-containing protein [Bacillus cereus group sp. BfR-BA-01492]EMA6342707.1 TetR/AcrR family transcriptional regulator C-terminal domain-containing protein [Bacillus cytotoxicus]